MASNTPSAWEPRIFLFVPSAYSIRQVSVFKRLKRFYIFKAGFSQTINYNISSIRISWVNYYMTTGALVIIFTKVKFNKLKTLSYNDMASHPES